jgi:acetyl esterase/lipase
VGGRRLTVGFNAVPGPLTDGTAAFPYAPPSIGPSGELRYDNVVYSCEPGYRPLFLDLRVPAPASASHPLIIWVHGGGWIYGSRRRLPPHLFDNGIHDRMLDAGFAVASVDYRLAGEAGCAGMLLDLKAAIRWLRGHAADFGLDPRRVVAWGESAGGHLAVMAALCTKLDGAERTGECLDQSETPAVVVDWYGPSDLTAMAQLHLEADSEEVGATPENPAAILAGCGDWTYAELSPVSYVRAGGPPVFVAHGTDDQIVPVSHSRDLADRLRAAGATVDYLEVPGADHVWRGAPSVADIVDRSLSFVTKALP